MSSFRPLARTRADAATHWRAVEDFRENLMEPHLVSIADALRAQLKQLVRAYKQGLSLESAVETPALRRAIGKMIREIFLAFAEETYHAVLESKQSDATFLSWEKIAAEFVKQEGMENVAEINKTSVGYVRTAIERGVAEGLPIRDIAKDIESTVGGVNAASRAERIARTISAGTSNHAAIEGARAAGIEMKKRWLATQDGSTRDTHLAAHGQTQELDQPFFVGDSSLRYPGDPRGSAKEIINCRCAVSFVVQ